MQEIRRCSALIIPLDHLRLEKTDSRAREQVWDLIGSMRVVDNKARLVAATKTLHHLLPDLVVPIDRAYTGTFLARNVLDFQNKQREVFTIAWGAFLEVARAKELRDYVGDGWRTSATKVIDNAIVGYCIEESLVSPKRKGPKHFVTGIPRRENWTIEQLRADLVTFEGELREAGLKEMSIRTYVGRSKTFLDWLDKRYEPRGPNM